MTLSLVSRDAAMSVEMADEANPGEEASLTGGT